MSRSLRYVGLEHPWMVMLLLLALLGGLSPLLGRLWLTIDYKVYFEPDDPQLQAMEALEQTFIEDNTLFVMVAPEKGGVFNRRILGLVDRLTKQSWQIPHSLRVSSLTNYQYSRAEGDTLEVFPLFGKPHTLSPEEIARRKAYALSDPAIAGDLVSRDGRVAAVALKLAIPDKSVKVVPEIAGAMRAVLDELRKDYPDVRFHLNGSVMADQSFFDAIEQDSQLLTPLSYLLIFSLIALLLRSLWAMGITLLVILGSVVVAFAGKALVNPGINTVTVIAPSVIMIVAVADSMHLFVSFFQYRREGADRLTAMRRSLDINTQPVVLTSLTTAVGFLSLNFSESPPLRDMGNTVALGTLAAMVFSLLLLPALVRLLPVGAPRAHPWTERLTEGLSEFTLGHRRGVLAVGLLVTAILLAGLPRNSLNEVFVEYFDDSFPFRQANEFMDANLRGVHRLNYSLDSGEPNGVYDPAFLRKVEAFADFLRSQPEVTDVESFVQVVKRLNRNMHGDDPDWYRLPESREAAAQYTLLYELSLPYGHDLTHLVSMDRSKTRVTAAFHLTGSENILALDARARQWLWENAPALETPGVSIDSMFSHIARENIPAMVFGTLAALVLISGLILLATRSVATGLISLIPNLLPMLMAFGLWGYLQGRIGLTESVIAGLTMGLIVDDTVHFLTKYLRARREQGLSAAEAVRYAHRTVGEALIMTSLVFTVGFAVLGLSPFTGNSHLGILTAMTIGFALLADLFLLPALLVSFERWFGKAGTGARPPENG